MHGNCVCIECEAKILISSYRVAELVILKNLENVLAANRAIFY